MKKVFCIGELLIDLVSTDKVNFIKKAGGAPANVAVAVSRLGGSPYFLGQVGDDSFGEFLEDTLKQNNVNIDYLKKYGETALAIVSLDRSGERSFNFYTGSGLDYCLNVENLGLSDNHIVHFGSATAFLKGELEKSYYDLLEQAKNKKALISFDPNFRDTLITKDIIGDYKKHCNVFMKEAHFIKLSDEEAMLLTDTKSLEEAVNFLKNNFKAVIAITLGKEGTMLIQDNKDEIIDSISINQKDSTGAGDAFVGGVLYSLSNNNTNFKEVIRFANIVGALTCEEYGAINSIPNIEKVRERL